MIDTPARFFFLVCVAILVGSLLVSSGAGADAPETHDNGNASATISWGMHDGTGLTPQGVTLSGASAVLPWEVNYTRWDRSSRFEMNESFGQNLTTTGSGIALRPDTTDYVAGGDFGSAPPWTYENGSTREVTARWDSAGFAELGHVASETKWDSMDSIANWTYTSGITGFEEQIGQVEGSGMMALKVITPSSGSGGAVRSSGVTNWSAVDRLILWIRMDYSLVASFNVTANLGASSGPLRGTASVSLAAYWQELVVDLAQLGSSSDRTALYNVMLNFEWGVPSDNTWFYVDDLRLGTAESFNETAAVTQSLAKANATGTAEGNGLLSFDWSLVSATGLQDYRATVNLTGPIGSYEATIPGASLAGWQSFTADVSPSTAAPGAYTLSFGFMAAAANATAIDARLWIDNVSLTFPDRHNGSYLSNAISLTSRSAFLNATWSASIPAETSAVLGLRTGNNSDPGSAGWGSWINSSVPGTYAPDLAPNPYFQLRVDLGTTNASRTPTLEGFVLEAWHRATAGTLRSDTFQLEQGVVLLHWKRFDATFNGTPAGSISFSVDDGSGWSAAVPGSDLSMRDGRSIRWQAVLTTSDGLSTPALSEVQITYEYLGPINTVVVSPSGVLNATSGETVHLQAAAFDVGGHLVSFANFTWSTNASGGLSFDNKNATFVAGAPGVWRVVATAQGVGVSGAVWVNVSAAPGTSNPADIFFGGPLGYYVLAVLGAAGASFLVYEVWVRRTFAIDDVFLIKKDGRLIMHNTRRMRADRDEDILSGMLTAILAFIRDADPEENGELKRFEIGGKTTLLERGEHVYLTAVYSGRVPRWAVGDLRRFVRDVEAKFGEAFARWDGSPDTLQGVKAYVDRLATRTRYRRPPPGDAPAT